MSTPTVSMAGGDRSKSRWSGSRLRKTAVCVAAGASLLALQGMTGPEPTYLLSDGTHLGVIRDAEVKWDPEPAMESLVSWWRPDAAADNLRRQRALVDWAHGRPTWGGRIYWPGWTRERLDSLDDEPVSLEQQVDSAARWSALQTPVPVLNGARLTVADLGLLGPVPKQADTPLPTADAVLEPFQYPWVKTIGVDRRIPPGRYVLGWLLVIKEPIESLDGGRIPGAVHGATFLLTRDDGQAVPDFGWFLANLDQDGVFGRSGPVLVCEEDYDHLTIRMRRHGPDQTVKEGRSLSLGHLALRLGDVLARLDDKLGQDDRAIATQRLTAGSLVYLRLVNTPMEVKSGDRLEVELGGVPTELNPRFLVE